LNGRPKDSTNENKRNKELLLLVLKKKSAWHGKLKGTMTIKAVIKKGNQLKMLIYFKLKGHDLEDKYHTVEMTRFRLKKGKLDVHNHGCFVTLML
jgi:hypothetical protein